MKKLTNLSKSLIGGYTTYRKAFTLIELLVVIAIIGILATVVIASLNSVRTKGRVAAIKSNLKNLQTQAIMYHNDNGTFVGLCTYNTTGVTAHSSIQPMIDALTSIAGADRVRCVVRTSDVPAGSSHFAAADGLQDKNFGVAVYYNDTHYAVDTQSVMTLDPADSGSANWANANNICANVGKRLPPVEVFKAIYDYSSSDVTQYGFTVNYYWSSTPAYTSTSRNYRQSFGSGNIGRVVDADHYVRCAS